jgi:hypothetical protein
MVTDISEELAASILYPRQYLRNVESDLWDLWYSGRQHNNKK